MSLVSLQNASFDYGRERILADASLNLLAGVKYALVGDNGAGKSTLLRLISGALPLHGGARQAAARATIRHLQQETTFDARSEGAASLHESVLGAAFPEELALEAELAAVASALESAPAGEAEKLARRQGRLQAEYERLQGYSARARIEAALSGLGLPAALWWRPLGDLSGGERRRAALASVLLGRGDLLLLDEPTNHLDLSACEWLEDHLLRTTAAAVLVSHDRQFLDRVATQTIHLADGRLWLHPGNYTSFARLRQERQRQTLTAWRRQQERIRKTEDFIQRNIAGQKTKQAQSRRKSLAREERLERPPPPRALSAMRLRPQRQSGAMAIEVEGLAKGFPGRPLWAGLSLRVTRGERVGIVGPNGCGKTTLLRVLAGVELADRGTVRLGHNVDLGYHDQLLRGVSDTRTVLEEMADVDPAAGVGELRGFLACFGFGPDTLDRPVGALSGGERARLALLRLIKEEHNTLLLDEPTNHLDIQGREALEEALEAFPGTLVVASHDRRFLDRLVRRLLVFVPAAAAGSAVELFPGNYAQWHARQAAPAATSDDEPPPAPELRAAPEARSARAAPMALSKNEISRRRRWMSEAEARISALERERARLIEELATPRLPPERLKEINGQLARLEGELARQLAVWEQWGREVEGAAGD